MLLEILNWSACLCTILSFWFTRKGNITWKFYILSILGCLVLIVINILNVNYPMILQYCVILAFSGMGLRKLLRTKKKETKIISLTIPNWEEMGLKKESE